LSSCRYVDFARVLRKLLSHERQPPAKHQRLDGRIHDILSKLPPPVPVYKLAFRGNREIGDAGMARLHLIPESVKPWNYRLADLLRRVSKSCATFSRPILPLLTSISRVTSLETKEPSISQTCCESTRLSHISVCGNARLDHRV